MPEGPTPVILSLDRMTKIHDVYPTENVLICEAGTILVDVQQAAADNDWLFPMSLATNAGGVNVLRHGNMRAQCLGLEVVRPDGTIWNGLSRLRKDNTGYDLRDLMIGSEGTLGIITATALRLMLRPQAQGTAMMAVRDPAAALDLLALAGDIVGEGLSAFELIHRQGLDFLAAVGPDIKTSFTDVTDWCVLVDVGLAAGGDPQEVLMALFEAGLTADLGHDGVIAQSSAQRHDLWTIRESIPEAHRRIGSISSHDIAVPLSMVPEFITKGGAALAQIGDMRVNCFGHLGDRNLHYSIFPRQGARPRITRMCAAQSKPTCMIWADRSAQNTGSDG